MGKDGECFSFAVFAFEFLQIFLAVGIVSKKKNGGLREGPLEMGITDFLARGTVAFTGGLFGAFDESAVGDEVLHARESVDVVDLVEDDKGEYFADAVDGSQTVKDVGVVYLGRSDDEEFEIREQGIVVIDKHKIDFDALLHAGIREAFGNATSVGFVGDLFADLREVVLAVGVLNMAEEFGTLSLEVVATPEEVPGRAHLLGINVSHRDHVSAKENTDLFGIDTIVFGFASMDRLHIEGVTEDEGDVLFGTEVGKPVPGEHALDCDDKVISIGFDNAKEPIGPRRQVPMDQDLSVLVEDTEVQRPGVEIDTAVELMLVSIETHKVSSFEKKVDHTSEHTLWGMLWRRP